jgi:hypothetical protein
MAEARKRLPELLRAAAESGPQVLYRRDEPVGAVVGPAELGRLVRAPRAGSIGADMAELRRILAEESYELELPVRRDRPNPFVHVPR